MPRDGRTQPQVSVDYTPLHSTDATHAAVRVLLTADGPLKYSDIARRAIETGLWSPKGRTPQHTMNRDIREDVLRSQAAGVPSVFVRHPGGLIGLQHSRLPLILSAEAMAQDSVRRHLLDALLEVSPTDFEHLCGELVRRLGFEDVEVTPPTADGGVDVRASYSCGGMVRQHFVLQVKRYRRRNLVGGRALRELRGSLEDHEQGVVLTTSGLLPRARDLAGSWRRPIELVDGDALAELFIKTELGVRRRTAESVDFMGFGGDRRHHLRAA